MYDQEDYDFTPSIQIYPRGIRMDFLLTWRAYRYNKIGKRFILRRLKGIGWEMASITKQDKLSGLLDYLRGYGAYYEDKATEREGYGMTKRGALRNLRKGRRRMKG